MICCERYLFGKAPHQFLAQGLVCIPSPMKVFFEYFDLMYSEVHFSLFYKFLRREFPGECNLLVRHTFPVPRCSMGQLHEWLKSMVDR